MIDALPAQIAELYPFEPHWVSVGGPTLHYVDEGPRSSDAVVLLHGNPTWGFLYRRVIPQIVAAGYRAIVPDHLGCGRSDHASSEREYAIVHHAARLLAVLDDARVERSVMFCQDWGGPIGMGAALARPGLLRGVGLGNTFWGEASDFHRRVWPWRGLHGPIAGPLLFGRRSVFLDGARHGMPPECAQGAVWAAYRLPWDAGAGAGAGAALAWPRAISLGAEHPTQPLADALWSAMAAWDIPVRCVWGAADPVFPWEDQGVAMTRRLPRGREHPPVLIPEGRHFVQEWAPDEVAAAMVELAAEAFAGKEVVS